VCPANANRMRAALEFRKRSERPLLSVAFHMKQATSDASSENCSNSVAAARFVEMRKPAKAGLRPRLRRDPTGAKGPQMAGELGVSPTASRVD
jgi:hypothetical protein